MSKAGDSQWSDSWRKLPRVDIQQRALLDAIRERMGLEGRNATWMQEHAGISTSAWGNYFRGDRDLRYPMIKAIAAALNTTAGALVARAEAREVELEAQITGSPESHAANISDPAIRAAVEEADAQEAAKRRRKGQPNG
jgi:hypothetical protein